jgi:hypothetical protein
MGSLRLVYINLQVVNSIYIRLSLILYERYCSMDEHYRVTLLEIRHFVVNVSAVNVIPSQLYIRPINKVINWHSHQSTTIYVAIVRLLTLQCVHDIITFFVQV